MNGIYYEITDTSIAMFLDVKTFPKTNSLFCYVMCCFLHFEISFFFLLLNISSVHFIRWVTYFSIHELGMN